MGIPDNLTCLLRNLYTGQEATVRTGHGTTEWFQIGKGVHQGCTLSPCLFNLYAEHIMRNASLDEAQAGINTARRNINNFRYADDITVQLSCSVVSNSLQSHGLQHARPPCPSPTPGVYSQSLLKLMSIESVMPSNHLILCHPLLFLPSIFPSFRVFSNESVFLIRCPKYWSFSFSISPSNEYSGLIPHSRHKEKKN